MPNIFILLPVYNRREITEKFVNCLSAQTFSNYHLILIDDGSNDGTADMVNSKIDKLTILKGPGDWWWAGSLQQGLKWLKENKVEENDLILFINDDLLFSADYLERACQVMTNKKGVLMLSRFKSGNSEDIVETGVFADLKHLRFEQITSQKEINCLSTRGLFVHWKDVTAIGDFHPKLLPHYLSDYEYTIRAHRKGFKCETSAELLIEPNFDTTGYHKIIEVSLWNFIKKYFSKKSPNNPIYWTSFVLLTSKPLWLIPSLMRVFKRTITTIFQASSESIKS
ncbi:MAG: glycosyltransferase family 2 protein [Methylotenera sp.]|nr:glycosyltransferase family 2 protein [Methylotenera sp.]